MNTFIWLLIATSSGHVSPQVIYKFRDKSECEKTVAEIEQKSKDKRAMDSILAICVSAKG